MNEFEKVARGERAQALLRDEIFAEAIEQVRAGIVTAWSSAPIRDKEGHHELKLMLKLLDDVISNIESVISGGKLAADKIGRESLADKIKSKFK